MLQARKPCLLNTACRNSSRATTCALNTKVTEHNLSYRVNYNTGKIHKNKLGRTKPQQNALMSVLVSVFVLVSVTHFLNSRFRNEDPYNKWQF